MIVNFLLMIKQGKGVLLEKTLSMVFWKWIYKKGNSHLYSTWWPSTRSMAQHCPITQFDEKKEITQKAILSFTAVLLLGETLSQHWFIMPQTTALLVDCNTNCCCVTKDNSSVQEEGFPATRIWLIANKMQICWFQKVHQAFHWFVPSSCQLAIALNCYRPPPAVQNIRQKLLLTGNGTLR